MKRIWTTLAERHIVKTPEGADFEWRFNPEVEMTSEFCAFLNRHANARITENLAARHSLDYHDFAGKSYVFKRFSPSDNKKSFRKIELSLKSYVISGAQRSFRGASWLSKSGIPTVRPVAWAVRGKGYRQVSYFVYEKLECQGTLQEAVDRQQQPPAIQSQLVEKMAGSTRAMHDAGLRHTDIVTHNFLYDIVDEKISVYLIDTDKVARSFITAGNSKIKLFFDLRCMRRLKLSQEQTLLFFTRYFNGEFNNIHLTAWKFWLLGGFNIIKRIKLKQRADEGIEKLKGLSV